MLSRDLETPVVPPGYHSQLAGHHWLQQVDYDGRPGNHIVLQWQPGAQAWCHSDQYSRGQDIDTRGWRYVAPCPLPEPRQRPEIIAWAWRCDGMRGWALGNLKPTPENCHKYEERNYDVRALVFEEPDKVSDSEPTPGQLKAGDLFMVELDPDHPMLRNYEVAKKHAVRVYRACYGFSVELLIQEKLKERGEQLGGELHWLSRVEFAELLKQWERTGWIEEVNPATKLTARGKLVKYRDHFDDPAQVPFCP